MKARHERHTFSSVPSCSQCQWLICTWAHLATYSTWPSISDSLSLLVRVPIWSYTFLGITFFNR
jgi:hypothetical protein